MSHHQLFEFFPRKYADISCMIEFRLESEANKTQSKSVPSKCCLSNPKSTFWLQQGAIEIHPTYTSQKYLPPNGNTLVAMISSSI